MCELKLFFKCQNQKKACITATAMEADDVRKEELIENKIEEVVGDGQENGEEDGGNLQFLKPFLSGWQRVWNNRKKWFAAPGSAAESVPDQPKILDVPDRPGEQQQTIKKDPGSTFQVKYRRMSLKRTGGTTEGFPNARHSLGAMNLTPRREFDDRPLTQVHTQVNINLNFSLFSCKIVIRLV